MRIPGFRRLATAYTVNELGNWVGDIALAILVYDRTGSALATAALFIATRFLPAFLGPPLLARIEPLGARGALPGLYVLEALAFVCLALVAGDFVLWLAIALATVDGTLAVAARALTRATAAALLEPTGRLRAGNGVLNVGFTAAGALGPALGGLAVASVGVQAALLVDAASFLAVALLLARGRSLPRTAEIAPQPWRARLRAGLSYIRRRPALRGLLVAQAAILVFFTAAIPIEVVYVKDTLGAGDVGYGALLASWGAGMVLGSVLFLLLRARPLPLLLAASTAAIGVAYLGLAAAPTLAAACAASLVGGAGNGVQWVAVVSAVQEATEAPFQGRVLALLEAVSSAMPGAGFLLGGAIAATLSPRASYLVAGAGALAVLAAAAAWLGRTPWGRGQPRPEPVAARPAGAPA